MNTSGFQSERSTEVHLDGREPSNGATRYGGDVTQPPRVRSYILIGIAVVLMAMVGLYLRSVSKTNHVALADSAKPVSVEPAQKGSFRPSREYVGSLEPWGLAKIGPQYVSAYVGTVLVRPGAVVKRGEVLATLDCRNSSALSREIAAKAKALDERRAAIEHETERMKQMTAGGFASADEVEQLAAKAASEGAEVESLKAELSSRSLEVDDCVLRAPFAGEIADRFIDPGAYVRPGQAVVTVIDRNTVRVTAEAPESDFGVVAPGSEVKIQVQTGDAFKATISRRAPAADENTRTVHFEIDVPNPKHTLPVGTTATVSIDVGTPAPATLVPLRAATIRGEKAALFTVENGKAKRVVLPVLGEAGGTLYVSPALLPNTPVVVEGRALLDDGDKVSAKTIAEVGAEGAKK